MQPARDPPPLLTPETLEDSLAGGLGWARQCGISTASPGTPRATTVSSGSANVVPARGGQGGDQAPTPEHQSAVRKTRSPKGKRFTEGVRGERAGFSLLNTSSPESHEDLGLLGSPHYCLQATLRQEAPGLGQAMWRQGSRGQLGKPDPIPGVQWEPLAGRCPAEASSKQLPPRWWSDKGV